MTDEHQKPHTHNVGKRMMSAEDAKRTADAELRAYADDPRTGTMISETPAPLGGLPLVEFRNGTKAGLVIAWKWCHRTGLTYSVRSLDGRLRFSGQHPTIEDAIMHTRVPGVAVPLAPAPVPKIHPQHIGEQASRLAGSRRGAE